jgi:hypothetical protein
VKLWKRKKERVRRRVKTEERVRAKMREELDI